MLRSERGEGCWVLRRGRRRPRSSSTRILKPFPRVPGMMGGGCHRHVGQILRLGGPYRDGRSLGLGSPGSDLQGILVAAT